MSLTARRPASSGSTVPAANPVARVAFGISLAVLVAAIGSQAVRWLQPVLVQGFGMPQATWQFLADWMPSLIGVLGILALVVGSAALRRPGPPFVPAIAVGIGVLAVVSIGSSWLFRMLTALTFPAG